ncbi:DUF3021 family protein [Rossellomorea sp. AcN35-11]|nr:DUF3021 domain-containing protein [Rossellomorea aquimaris]WJV29633.1 DUF3021 family protein [Rossellomorea sp. AcN35-11]
MNLLIKGLMRGIILLAFFLFMSLWKTSPDHSSIFYHYGLMAFFLGCASVVYEIKQWSFSKQIIVHYLVMLITVFPTLLLSGFHPLHTFGDVVKVFFQFNKVGIILFLVTYFIFKIKTKFHYSYSK